MDLGGAERGKETRPGRLKLRPTEGEPRMSEGQREEQRVSSIGGQFYCVAEGAEGCVSPAWWGDPKGGS